MKLVRLSGRIGDFDRIVQTCVVNREFHPENAFDIMQSAKTLHRMDNDNPYTDLLSQVRTVADECSISLAYNDFAGKIPDADTVRRSLDEYSSHTTHIRSEIDRLTRLAHEDTLILEHLEHIHGLNINLEEFFDLKYVKFRFGRIPREIYDGFLSGLPDSDDYYYYQTGIDRNYAYILYLMPTKLSEKVDTLFASLRFERIYISDRVHGTADIAEAELKIETDANIRTIDSYEKELADYTAQNRDMILSCYSYAKYMSDSFDLRRYAVCTTDSFYLYGWVPAEMIKNCTALFDKVPGLSYEVENSTDAIITPPVKLKNSVLFKPFEPFVEMYGRPSYNEIDPTPIMAVLYTLLYGIMFGDIGQGILLALIGHFFMWKLKKLWLGRVLVYAGIAGACFGFVYGSLFGYEHILPFGFKVLESSQNTNLMLQTAVYIGVVVIALIIILNILNGIKQKDLEKALFSQNGVAGLVLYICVMALVLPFFGFLDADLSSPLLIVGGVILPLILIVLRHPLGKLVSRDPDWKPESIVDFLLENVFELIEVFLSYLSNTISFLRVGIFALSHAGMMLVVFLLAGPNENPVVIIIGNLLVMGLEGLLVGIQVLRLNFYEMFGRFFEADGRAYQPVIINYSDSPD